MPSSKRNGSLTHMRYGHKSRPRLIDVICPSCGCLARATKPSEENLSSMIVFDLSPSYHLDDWTIKCFSCPKRMKDVPYKELPDLFFSRGDLDVWAWNIDHAKFITDYLSGNDTSSNPYNWFTTYVRGLWKKHPDKAVAELLEIYKNALKQING